MKLAKNGVSDAVSMILESNLLECIAELALNGDSRAIDRVLESDDYNTIVKLALNGDSRAIRKSFVTRECKSYISEMRNAGDLRAREVIRKWYQR